MPPTATTPARDPFSDDPLERVLARSRSAARRLFIRFSVPPPAAQRLLDACLPALESPRGNLPGSCHRLLETLEQACRRFRDRDGEAASGAGEGSYDGVFVAIADAIRQRGRRRDQEQKKASAAVDELIEQLDAGLDPVEHAWDPEECSAALAEKLLERCRRDWSRRRDHAERYAKAAMVVLDVIASSGEIGLDHESPGILHDLTARAWTYLGNVHRQRGDLKRAEQAFAASAACLAQGSRHPLERAHALVIESALRRDQGRYADALRLLQQAAAIFRWAGDRSAEGGIYQRMASVQSAAGKPRLALPLAESALELIDSERDPWHFAIAQQNLALFLCDLERFADARRLLPEVQRRFTRHARSDYDHLTVLWLEARILAGEKRTGPAMAILESLRESYLELERPFDAALVSLELVAEHLEQGNPRPARELAAQALPVLQSLEIERPTLAAVLALRQAMEMETATAGWVRSLVSALRRPGAHPRHTAAEPS